MCWPHAAVRVPRARSAMLRGPFNVYVDEAGNQSLKPAVSGGGGPPRSLLQSLESNIRIVIARSAIEYVSGYFADLTAAGNDDDIYIPAPITGALTSIRIVAGFQPSANMPIQAAIGGTNVTDGLVTILSTDGAGTVRSASPTGQNAVTAGTTAIRLRHNATNTVAGHAWVVLGFSHG
ncbi:hypothetical protein [Nannocystis bainbridge]|uniref:Uncharacterized protein n=1 Tax=Nannocystis bainbridge TaxID=2995303 RepID=A0ABT5E7C7_9BACT|nr:hypothetical protein [Nannocystis bainbridge]MDC0720676.1 hypothetical protein [Nannocystis bainbridge]